MKRVSFRKTGGAKKLERYSFKMFLKYKYYITNI